MDQPGELDEELGEFWVGNPWEIFEEHNLSRFEPNRAFLNSKGKGFVDVSFVSGAATTADSRGVLAADLDNDGRMDLVVRQAGGGPLKIFRNRLPARPYLKVSLRGTSSNRLGVGARLVTHVGDRKLVRELYPSNSYRAQNPAMAHFGLDTAARVDRLDIHWPSGRRQQVYDLAADQHVVIQEGSDRVEVVEPGRRIVPRDPSPSARAR